MRSKTSFFNLTIFKRSVSRFWPIWALYAFAWLLAMPVHFLSGPYGDTENLGSLANQYITGLGVYAGVIGGAVMAIAAAMAVWSFLYSARSAHGIACLPLRREGVWCSAMLAGLVPAVAIYLIVGLLTLLVWPYGATFSIFPAVLRWFGLVTLIYFFFYSFATLCAMLTGNIVILPLVYGVLNFVVVGVEVLLRTVFSQFVYGLDMNLESITTRYFSPVIGYLFDLSKLTYIYQVEYQAQGVEYVRTLSYGWRTVWLYALVGLVMLAGALLLYRKRRMETAGDVVAVQVLKPVFRWCMAIGNGLALSSLMFAIFYMDSGAQGFGAFPFTVCFLLVGAVIGWFGAEMLIRKRFRVFTKRRWAGCGLACLVLLALMVGMRLDLFGVERRVPEPSRVESVVISANGVGATLTTAEGIEQARALHKAILADRTYNGTGSGTAWDLDSGDGRVGVSLKYLLRGGGTLSRYYTLRYSFADDTRGETAALQELMNCEEARRNRMETGVPLTRETIDGGWVDAWLTVNDYAALMGFDDPETCLLSEFMGCSSADIAAMDERERQELVVEVARERTLNKAAWSESYLPDYASLNYDELYLSYSYSLSTAEAWDFYDTALRPDNEEGKLGKVYVLQDEEYANETYDATICITWKHETRTYYGNPYFNTKVAVDAKRTVAWLAEHGMNLHTPAELWGVG